MPFLLVATGQVMCAHAGKATPALASVRVMAGGAPIVTQSGPWTIAGCPNQTTAVPPTPFPCVSATFSSGAVRVTSMNQPVLLQSSMATATPTGTPLTIVPTPGRVEGM